MAKALLLTLTAAALRLIRLDHWSLWIDEGNTLWLTQHMGEKLATRAYPLFFHLERLMIELLGSGELALRLLPAIAGILSAPLLYLLFRRPAGEAAAFWAALLLAFSPWHLFWSQNARYYSLLLLEAMLLFSFAWRWLESGSWRQLVGLLLTGLAGMATHFTLALAWPGLILFPLLAPGKDRPDWRRKLWYWAALLVPLLLAASRLLDFSEGFSAIPRHYGDNPLRLLAALGWRIGLPLIIAALFGVIAGLRSADGARRRFALFVLLGAGLPALLAALATLKIIATSYYVFFALPLFLLAAAMALDDLPGRAALLLGLVLCGFYLHRDALYFTSGHGDRIRWREAVEYVLDARESGDRILSGGSEAVSYYLGEAPALLNGTDKQTMIQWRLKDKWLTPRERTWYVINDVLLEELDGSRRFRDFLRDECRQMKIFPAWTAVKNRTVRVWLYDPR